MVAEQTMRTANTRKRSKKKSEGERYEPSRAGDDTVRRGLRGLFYEWYMYLTVQVQPPRLVNRTEDAGHSKRMGVHVLSAAMATYSTQE
eukprot:2223762-Amphidinium_carterae.1